MNSYQKALKKRKECHLLRVLHLPSEGIDFYSNDYLGLAQSPDLYHAIEKECQSVGNQNGSTGSRLLSGNSVYAEKVEKKIADFHKSESALVYSSGYAANLGLISCLAIRETTLICDELIHASLIDGIRLGHAKRVWFRHNNINDLESKLQSHKGQKLVVVESVYSMDGDICPIQHVVQACKKYNALLIVDEAHSMGIYGKNGEGIIHSLEPENYPLARIVTYGKGSGIHGAAVIGAQWLKDYQINFSRSVIFSTAPTIHHFAAISAMYDFLPKIGANRKRLQANIDYFISKRNKSHKNWLDSYSQIQLLIVPGNQQVNQLANRLKDANINVFPIRKPSVAEGTERIRFCLHAYNTKEEIDLLFNML